MKRILLPPLACVALLGLAGCGGSGGHSSPASGSSGSSSSHTLTYVNPTNASGTLALVLDAEATPTNLILDLVGGSSYPATGPATGVSFAFDVDTTQAVWSTVLTNGTLFTNLGTGVQLARGWVAGGRIQGLVSYKGSTSMVSDLTTGVIAKVTLTPAANATAGTVSLVDAGLGAVIQQTPPAIPMQIAVGTLTVK